MEGRRKGRKEGVGVHMMRSRQSSPVLQPGILTTLGVGLLLAVVVVVVLGGYKYILHCGVFIT